MSITQSYKPVGRLDGANAATHEQALLALVSDGLQNLTVDLSELEYISSAGLRVLLVAAKAARSKGGGVVLKSPRPAILEVLKISGFDKILQVQI
jgi:anti-anti-sigma factor